VRPELVEVRGGRIGGGDDAGAIGSDGDSLTTTRSGDNDSTTTVSSGDDLATTESSVDATESDASAVQG
jgi:hypothetical protein